MTEQPAVGGRKEVGESGNVLLSPLLTEGHRPQLLKAQIWLSLFLFPCFPYPVSRKVLLTLLNVPQICPQSLSLRQVLLFILLWCFIYIYILLYPVR